MTEVPPAPPAPQFSSAPPSGAPLVRPGGLTALAVLNFVFGGLGAIGTIVIMIGLAAAKTLMTGMEAGARNSGDPNAQEAVAQIQAATSQVSSFIWVGLLIALVAVVLLFVAGVGYLKMSRMGYLAGNAYGALAILGNIISVASGGGFGAGTFIGLAYPVITLILLNTTFKKCFPAA
jgi:hypothetical protein